MYSRTSRWALLFRWVPEEDHKDEADSTDGQVDVETPTPSGTAREASADQGAHNRCNTKHHAEETLKGRPAVQGDHRDHDQHAAGEDTGRSHASNGTTNDEYSGAWCRAADGGANLEDDNADQKDPIDGEFC